MTYTYTTQAQIRAAFWREHPRARRAYVNGPRRPIPAPQNQQPVDTRIAFCDFVDALSKNGEISAHLADRVTL